MNEKQVAQVNDGRLFEMAVYHETRGLLRKVGQPEVMERFKYFKHLIKRGSFEIDELEKKIFEKNGIVQEDIFEDENTENTENYRLPRNKEILDLFDAIMKGENNESNQR